jgi:hypothetical protein
MSFWTSKVPEVDIFSPWIQEHDLEITLCSANGEERAVFLYSNLLKFKGDFPLNFEAWLGWRAHS